MYTSCRTVRAIEILRSNPWSANSARCPNEKTLLNLRSWLVCM